MSTIETVFENMFVVAWFHLTTSSAVQIFTLSFLVLICGIAIAVWQHAVHLKFLDSVSIDRIEFGNVHLPSLRAIVAFFLCCVVLLTTSLLTMWGVGLFDQPYEWLYLVVLFVVIGAAGAVLELRWHGTRDIMFGFLLGSTIALLSLLLVHAIPLNYPILSVALLGLLIASGYLAYRVLFSSWSRNGQLAAVISFLTWLAVSLIG
jgi:hypothetical protein